MLSSRYLHLHEALGLGPMWLKQGAKVLPATASGSTATTVAVSVPSAQAAAEHQPVSARTASHARLAAMAAIGKSQPLSDGTSARSQGPSENIPANTVETPAAQQTQALPAAIPNTAPVADIQPARLMVVSICPALEDSTAGRLFSGDAGILLDNMLASIGLQPADAHKTVWVKTAAVFTPEPSSRQIAEGLPQLQAELAASQALSVLFLGQIFERPHHTDTIRELCGDLPYFIIPHPARLLRQPHLKRQAWEELKKLRSHLSGQPSEH
ncbi:uracil-DNA glycosylase family protein [Neisseria dumasiana]|uniref:uracil-DNA glycosylase family protein n=1 Tax=Neisseria dumasiana TaxID=1931275 RepID=UPI000A1957A8|nr:uracil-DNA glycosylase family protein [Neisseria dumasiana]OSI16569.1 hypothetical protein BV914_03000 [Neisseria dumasiana]